MARVPSEGTPESSLAFMRDPYRFISRRSGRHRADLFEARFMFQPTLCMTGPQAAELLYDEGRFARAGAAPARVQETLFGRGGVQSLDGEAHRNRKHALMSVLTGERVGRLEELVGEWVRHHARGWAARDAIRLYDELQQPLTRAACEWAGVPLADSEVTRRTRQLTALFDAAGAVGPAHWRSRLARNEADRWIAGVVEDVRAGRIAPAGDTAVHVLAWHRDVNGDLLDPRVAAVEVLNVLRPTVAVSVFLTFIAHALHQYPACRRKLEAGADGYPELFVQEVRRSYPFFPVAVAVVRDDFGWKGYHFPRGRRVLLDLYGTNHDPRAWQAPEEFRPERFAAGEPDRFTFIPQGGGDPNLGHRCAGERITTRLMALFTRLLTEELSYDVPEQDLRIDFARLPALPASRLIIRNMR